MEGTSLLTELNHFDQTLSPSDILDITSVDRFRALLNHSDRHVKQLASRILLEHNHDVALQTKDHKIVPLSFAVLSKFSEIFPEESHFLQEASEPIPIPISSGSLDLILKAWKGESIKKILCGDNETISKTKKLLKGLSFLAAEGSLCKGNFIYAMIRALAPDLKVSIPSPHHLRIWINGFRDGETGWEQLKKLLLLAKRISFSVTVLAKPYPGVDVIMLKSILENDQIYPIHALSIQYPRGVLPVIESSFFQFLERNHTLQSLAVGKKKAWLIPNYAISRGVMRGLQVSQSVRNFTIHGFFAKWLDLGRFAKTLEENPRLKALSLDGSPGGDPGGRLLTEALIKGRALEKIDLFLDDFPDPEATAVLIRQAPNLESFNLITNRCTCAITRLAKVFLAFEETPRLREISLNLGPSCDHRELFITAMGGLLAGNRTLRKLEFSTFNIQFPQPWERFFEGFRNNIALKELTLFGWFPDTEDLMTELLTVVGQHPKLTRLGLPSGLTSRQLLKVCNFLRDNPPLQHLSLAGNTFLGEEGRKSGVFTSLIDALAHNTHLKSLDLRSCHLKDAEAVMLGEYLTKHHTLEKLRVEDGNFLTLKGGKALAQAVDRNTSLVSMSINEWIFSSLKKKLLKASRRKEYFNWSSLTTTWGSLN